MLGHANRIFCQSTLPSNYATLACGRAAPSGEVVICNAGHCPPLMLRRNGVRMWRPPASAGLFCDGKYAAREFVLDPAIACSFTPTALQRLPTAPATSTVPGAYGRSQASATDSGPSLIIEAILADVRLFVSGSAHADDIAILVMRREGGS